MKNGVCNKFKKYTLIYVVMLFVFLISVESVKIKSKFRSKSSTKSKADDDVNANDIPGISVHMEDHDGDPLNFVKFNNERRDMSLRYAEMQMRYDGEKKALMKLLTHQTAKLAELTEIAEITVKMIDQMI